MARTYDFQITNETFEIIGTIKAESVTAAKSKVAAEYGVKRITATQANIIKEGIEMTFVKVIEEINATTDLQEKLSKLEALLLKAEKRGDDVKVNLIAEQMANVEAMIAASKPEKKVVNVPEGKRKYTADDAKKDAEKADQKSGKGKKTVKVDMDKAKAPKEDKASKTSKTADKAPKETTKKTQNPDKTVMTEAQEYMLGELQTILVNEDAAGMEKKFKMTHKLDENGVVIVKTEATTKKFGEKYRTIYLGRRGGIQAWGKRTKGTPKYLTIPREVIAYGFNTEPKELKA